MVMRRTRRRRRERGFTIIELMVVVGLIAILAAIMTPFLNDYLLKNRLQQVVTSFRSPLQWAQTAAGRLNTCIAIEIRQGTNTLPGYARVYQPIMDPLIVPERDRTCDRSVANWASTPAKRIMLKEFNLASVRSGQFLGVQITSITPDPGATNLPFYLLADSAGTMFSSLCCGRITQTEMAFRFELLRSDGQPMWPTLPDTDPRKKVWIRDLYTSPTGVAAITLPYGEI